MLRLVGGPTIIAGRVAMAEEIVLPIAFDLAATALFALSGALRAVEKRYDVAGVVTLALVAGVGGGILRDGVFLQHGPPAVAQDARYLWAVGASAFIGYWFGPALQQRFAGLFLIVDALGLGAYGVVGAQKALAVGLSVPGAVLVGVVNAVGGGVVRDVLAHAEPEVFKPGGYYALAAFAGVTAYVVAVGVAGPGIIAAGAGIAATVALRVLSVYLGWQTRPAPGRISSIR